MDTSGRLLWILGGLGLVAIGINTLVSDSPAFSVRDIITVPAVRWVGWPCVFCGLALAITNTRGFFIDRKNQVAALARCKARREQEAEAAKAEDNQHP